MLRLFNVHWLYPGVATSLTGESLSSKLPISETRPHQPKLIPSTRGCAHSLHVSHLPQVMPVVPQVLGTPQVPKPCCSTRAQPSARTLLG